MPTLHALPAVLANQRHKAHRSDFRRLEAVSVFREHIERLFLAVAERNQNPSTLGQLFLVSRRNFGGSGPNEYSIIRRILAPPQSSVSEKERNVSCANLPDSLARLVEESGYSLDRKDLGRQLREECRLIS